MLAGWLFGATHVQALATVTALCALESRIVALAIFLLALRFFAVAPAICMPTRISIFVLEILLCFLDLVEVEFSIVAAVARTVGVTHFTSREALAIHFEAVSFFAAATCLLASLRIRMGLCLLLHKFQSQRVLRIQNRIRSIDWLVQASQRNNRILANEVASLD